MDLEAPADAWYVWIGVALVSVAVAGVAVGLPTAPPPDAESAANAIDGVAGSTQEAYATYDHDAAEVRIDGTRLSLRDDHGTGHASVAYGEVVPVEGDERLENVVYGASPEDEFADVREFVDALEASTAANAGEWRESSGQLSVRTVHLEVGIRDLLTSLAGVSDREELVDAYGWLEYTEEGSVHVTLVTV